MNRSRIRSISKLLVCWLLVLACASPAAVAALTPGSWGEEVKSMQMMLIDLGFLNDKADGVYGDKTVAAVKKFQIYRGLDQQDGAADDETLIDLRLVWRTTMDEQRGVTLPAAPVQTSPSADGVQRPSFKILIIGNSFNQDAVAYLPPVLNEMLPEVDITYGVCFTSSADIIDHIIMFQNDAAFNYYNLWTPQDTSWRRYSANGANPCTLREVLAQEEWDIILTNATTSDVYPDRVDQLVLSPLRQLMRILQSNARKPFQMMWFQVMGRADNSTGVEVSAAEMYRYHTDATLRVMAETGVYDYIPVGTAFENARTNPELQPLGYGGNLLYSDHKHIQAGLPALLATYTTALKLSEWYGCKSAGVYGSSFVPTLENVMAIGASSLNGDGTTWGGMTHGQPAGITDEYGNILYNNIQLIQEIAVLAVKYPDVVTDCAAMGP